MPVTQTLTVTAATVKRGDELVLAAADDIVTGRTRFGKGHTVTAAKRGDVNVTYETTGGIVRVRQGGFVTVGRQVKTDAEKRAELKDQLDHELRRAVDGVAKWADNDPAAFLAGKLAGYPADRIHDALTWYTDETIELSVQAHIGRQVREMLARLGATAPGGVTVTYREVFDAMVDDATQQVSVMARYPESGHGIHAVVKRRELAVYADLLDHWDVKGVQWLIAKLAES